MPYLLPADRQRLDTKIDELADIIKPEQRAGDLNYIINRLMLKIVGDARYKDVNELVGALECAKLEFYRRQAAPYEDKVAKQNGDLDWKS